eukprot:TRINITY_DN23089_c0_g1_i1.p1 TRINITY_DN23089_c0_g1~~TRINITY_DN23089_c0_g1_i1.p1  ORF type:complete len:776 (-),score=98.57 TRINITY_DN23089_c0_g1_i1:174-2501(-)
MRSEEIIPEMEMHDENPARQVELQDFLSRGTKRSRLRTCLLLLSGLTVVLAAASFGALLALHVQSRQALPQQSPLEMKGASSDSLSFYPSRASEVLGELSVNEVRKISSWFCKRTGAAPYRSEPSVKKWLAGPSAVELLRPPKSQTLAYLDGKGPKPARYARVVVADEASVIEYKVGPIALDGNLAENATITPLVPAGSIPYSKRPGMLEDIMLLRPLLNDVVRELGSLLTKTFGPVWPALPGFQPERGNVTFFDRNIGLAPSGKRWTMLKSFFNPPAPSRADSAWLHPIPLEVAIDITSWNVSTWKILSIGFCGQTFDSAALLKAAELDGTLKSCSADMSNAGGWDTPQVEGPPVGTRAEERNSGVSWGAWNFSVTQRPSTGLAVTDIRFKGERVVYELALADATATYAGNSKDQFMYSDTAFTMSQMSVSLKPGLDCPDGARYLAASNWVMASMLPDVTKAEEFWPICIFEWVEDHTVWRHMDQREVRGLLRKTLVVRSVATVANYDYITDVKFREDGEINVATQFAGYPETRWPGQSEDTYSTIVRPHVAGMVHTHSVAFKADIDVSGSSNALRVSEVEKRDVPADVESWQKWPTKVLTHRYVEKEGNAASTFVADAGKPKAWTIVNRKASATAGAPLNPRGYRVELMSFATKQVHSADHPYTKAMPWSKYHLAVTKYHDDEYRPSDPYANYDDTSKIEAHYAQDLDRFLNDEEQILDEDLVAWIGLSKEHIVRQEDLPLVSNFGVAFSLLPFNLYPGNIASNPSSPPRSEL